MSTQQEVTSLYEVVAEMQESMEEIGLPNEIVDAIVSRGLEVLLGFEE
jgi:hypothetical protein